MQKWQKWSLGALAQIEKQQTNSEREMEEHQEREKCNISTDSLALAKKDEEVPLHFMFIFQKLLFNACACGTTSVKILNIKSGENFPTPTTWHARRPTLVFEVKAETFVKC